MKARALIKVLVRDREVKDKEIHTQIKTTVDMVVEVIKILLVVELRVVNIRITKILLDQWVEEVNKAQIMKEMVLLKLEELMGIDL